MRKTQSDYPLGNLIGVKAATWLGLVLTPDTEDSK